MKIGHYAKFPAPYNIDELCALGERLWEWEHFCHGSDSEDWSYMFGRFRKKQDGTLLFHSRGSDGLHTTRELDFNVPPVRSYIEFVD